MFTRFAVIFLSVSALGYGQSNPLTTGAKRDFTAVKNYFIRSADKMSDADYAFRPTPDVRTFGQIVAHVADDQYNLCAAIKGETRKESYTHLEETLSTKADLVAALKKSFDYCDAAYALITDANAAAPLKGGSMNGRTNLLQMYWNIWHTWEHYGNVVVYQRMKGLVPPSSERSAR
jgi:uncharacterized damage-inducible protein DinB